MDCNKARTIILDRHDGTRYPSAAPEEHLRCCDGCQRFAKELETLASDFAAADELRPLDDELRARILASTRAEDSARWRVDLENGPSLAAVAAAGEDGGPRRGPALAAWPVGLAAAAVLLLVVGWLAVRTSVEQSEQRPTVSPDQQDVEAAGQWVVAMRQTLDQSVKEMQQIGTRPFGEEWDRLHETGRSLLDCFPLNLSYRLIPADDGEES